MNKTIEEVNRKLIHELSLMFTKELHDDATIPYPTCKPVRLLEWLIKTYSNERETVVDMTIGSGSTGVACVKTKRNFIGIELTEEYFEIAKKRIHDAEIDNMQRLDL